jgi:hypothetical protein
MSIVGIVSIVPYIFLAFRLFDILQRGRQLWFANAFHLASVKTRQIDLLKKSTPVECHDSPVPLQNNLARADKAPRVLVNTIDARPCILLFRWFPRKALGEVCLNLWPANFSAIRVRPLLKGYCLKFMFLRGIFSVRCGPAGRAPSVRF